MCSCAFYPLHLVYSGLIWIFGVRVNYIYKLFLHFYIHMLAHRVLSWFSKIRHSELNSERKLVFTVLTLPITKRFFYQFFTELALIEHQHISWLTFQHVHFGHVHGYWDNYLQRKCVAKKEMSGYRMSIKCSQYQTHMDISFFLSFIIHTYSL